MELKTNYTASDVFDMLQEAVSDPEIINITSKYFDDRESEDIADYGLSDLLEYATYRDPSYEDESTDKFENPPLINQIDFEVECRGSECKFWSCTVFYEANSRMVVGVILHDGHD